MSVLSFVLILTLLSLCSAYKLLLVFPFPSLSHSVFGEGYVRILSKAGHEVTYITPYPIKNATKGLRQIQVTNNKKILPALKTVKENIVRKHARHDSEPKDRRYVVDYSPSLSQMGGLSPCSGNIIDDDDIFTAEALNITHLLINQDISKDIGTVFDEMMKTSNAAVMHTNVQKLLNDKKEEFDAVIVEWMYSEIYAGFSSVFNCPLIWSSPMEPNELLLSLLNEQPESYAPSPLSFWQRMEKQFRLLHIKLHKWLQSGEEESVFNRAFGPPTAKRGGILPPFEVVKHNGSLLLGNSHLSTGRAFRLPVNYIQIAGYHIEEKRKPLTKNLQKIMDASKKGVVYFSMGPTLKGSTLPENVIEDILDVFQTVNMTVIWEYEKKIETPQNVHLFYKDLQQSILAHLNCVLFITPGDLQSFIEAVHFGVPIIGIPILENQFYNVEKAINKGFGKKADIRDIKTLKAALNDVIRNTKYLKRARELSSLYHDRPIPPSKELLYWIEHVIRTKGAPHLRSPRSDSCCNTSYFELSFVILTPIVCLFVLIVFLFIRQRKDDDIDFKKFI